MAIFIHGKCQIYKSIPFAGKQVDENIQQAIARKKNCLISQEEAKRLKEEANISFQRKLPSLLHGIGMDRYQRFVSFSILSSDLWPSVDEVEKQIILWAKSLLIRFLYRRKRKSRKRNRIDGRIRQFILIVLSAARTAAMSDLLFKRSRI